MMGGCSTSESFSYDSSSNNRCRPHQSAMHLTWWDKIQYRLRLHLGVNRKRLKSNVETVIVGSGVYKGECTNEFIQAAAQRLFYFSYRYGFSRLPNGHTTDTGWGCLLRTGQMVMGQALIRFYRRDAPLSSHLYEEIGSPRSFAPQSGAETNNDTSKTCACHHNNDESGNHSNANSVTPAAQRVAHGSDEEQYTALHHRVQQLFMDSVEAPFGVHAIEHEAHVMGIPYSTYLAPTQAGHAFANACTHYRERLSSNKSNTSSDTNRKRSDDMPVHGAPVTICCDTRSINATTAKALLAASESIVYLIPVFLGAGKLHGVYVGILKMILCMHSCCGCAGGQHSASLYFIGYQEDYVIYFDPHHVQKAFVSASTEFSDTQVMRGKTKIASLEPCMLIGFYVQDESAFHRFVSDLAEVNSRLVFPLISVVDGPVNAGGKRHECCETQSSVDNDDVYSISTASSSSSASCRASLDQATDHDEGKPQHAEHYSQT